MTNLRENINSLNKKGFALFEIRAKSLEIRANKVASLFLSGAAAQ